MTGGANEFEIQEGSVTPYLTLLQGWRRVPLRSVCQFRHGGTPSKAREDFWGGAVPWVSPKDMRPKLVADSSERITEKAVEAGADLLPIGSILIVVRSGILARTVPISRSIARVAINQDIKAIVPNTDQVDAEFLHFVLMCAESEMLSQGIKKGATVHSFKSGYIESLEIPLPPLLEQKRISALLAEQMAAVDQARAAAQARLAAIKALPAAYLREVFDSAEARQWSIRRLADFAKLERGKFTPRPRNDPRYYGGSYPWIQTGQVEAANKLITTSHGTLNEAGLAVSKLFRKGTLIITIAANIGAVGILDFDSCMPDSLVAITPKDQLADTEFLYYRLLFMRSAIKSLAPQMAQANLKLELLRPIEIALPSLDVQESIASSLAAKFKTVDQLRLSAQAELAAIEALPAALLRRAFSGELSQTSALPAPRREHRLDRRAALVSLFAHRWSSHRRRSGHLKLAKGSYEAETHAGFVAGGSYDRAPLGPYDPEFPAILQHAIDRGWLAESTLDPGQTDPTYVGGPKIADALQWLEPVLGEQREAVEKLADLMQDWKADKAERVATLFAAWNDFLIDGREVDDAMIVSEVRERWHAGKAQRFTAATLHEELGELRRIGLVPTGWGPRTQGGQPSLAFK